MIPTQTTTLALALRTSGVLELANLRESKFSGKTVAETGKREELLEF
jgi:hypothetical protein